MRLTRQRVIDAVAWRWKYYFVCIGRGILARCWRFPSLFSSIADCVTYAKAISSLNRREAVKIQLRQMQGNAILCRPGRSDPWVLWDTFKNRFHLPPAGINPQNCILDLGANVGYTAAHLATLYPNARIIAVEMDSDNAVLAQANLRFCARRCEVTRAAIWDQDGEVFYQGTEEQGFRVSNLDGIASSDSSAPSITISTILERCHVETVDYVKMDIEGAEDRVFNGSLDWTGRVKTMKVEIHYPASYESIASKLTSVGFDCNRDNHHPNCLVAVKAS